MTTMTPSNDPTTVLITGGNKGLGQETARRLGGLGWRIFLGARDRRRGTEATEKLIADGVDATFVPLDVTSEDSATEAVRLITEHTDRLDVLINNAGITGEVVTPADTGVEHLRPVFEVNVFGPVRLIGACLSLLRAADNPRVVMVSSGVGSFAVTTDPDRLESSAQHLAYPASKAALNMIASQYAKSIPELKINIADPGYTATDLNGNSGTQTVTEGTDAVVELATLGPDGPTGAFIDRSGAVPW